MKKMLKFFNLVGQEHQFVLVLRDYVGGDTAVDRAIVECFNKGEFYEPDVSALIKRVVSPGDVFIDVGANIGYHSILAGCMLSGTGMVVSCEPCDSNLIRLRDNIEANNFDNFIIIDRVIANFIGSSSFYLNDGSNGSHAVWDPGVLPTITGHIGASRKIIVNTTTLEDIYNNIIVQQQYKKIVIKIDVEGAEQLVLEGGSVLLSPDKVPFIVCELHSPGLHQLGHSQTSLRGLMYSKGYETFLLDGLDHGKHSDRVPKYIPKSINISSNFFPNILFSTIDYVGSYWTEEKFLHYQS
ncbi:MAG: FkbM family methyltransferase [Magnetococcales bacterium]|nr:FkbM family methyltransferase [Magnetococcales bacterium]